MEIEIALRKHELPFEFSKEALAEAKKLPDEVREERLEGPRGPARAAAGHHRRRDGEGLRRRRVLRAPGQGLPAGRGHRRRLATTCSRAWRSTRSLRARQLGVFPAPRDSDAAGEALQRPVLAQPAGRAPVHGLRHGRSRASGEIKRLPLLPGGDVLARAADLQPGGRCAVRRGRSRETKLDRACCRICENLDALFRVLLKARAQARRHRLRDGRNADGLRRPGQDRAHRPGTSATTRTA